jgi:hypothetical protein
VRWYARGRKNKLKESFIPPHIEPAESLFEVFELVKGEAYFVFHENDDINSPCKFVRLKPHEPVIAMPGQIHSILCVSENVEVVEFKVVSPNKICPQFARDANLVDEKCGEQKGPQIDEYLDMMHRRANDKQR